MNSFDELIATEPSGKPLTVADIQAAYKKLSETSRPMQVDAKVVRAILDYNGLTEDWLFGRDTNFADEAVRNCNKTSGNGEEATREPDLNSAARKPMQ